MNIIDRTQKLITEKLNPNLFRIWHQQAGNRNLMISYGDDLTFRAYSTKELIKGEVHYSIHVNIGSLYLIHEYLKVYLSNNEIFPGIGKSSEVIKIPSLRERDYKILASDLSIANDSFFDEEREKLHSFLFTITAKFIIYHEYIHIANGHIDLQEDYKAATRDLGNPLAVGLSKLDFQTLEMDSDACAICDLYDEYRIRSSKGDPDFPVNFNNQEKIIYSLLFCKLLIMNVFSNYSMTDANMRGCSHPYSLLRFDMIAATIATKLLKIGEEYVLQKAIYVWADFYDNYDIVIEEKEFNELRWHISNETHREYVAEIGRNWNSLRCRLEKYAFELVELPPLYEG